MSVVLRLQSKKATLASTGLRAGGIKKNPNLLILRVLPIYFNYLAKLTK